MKSISIKSGIVMVLILFMITSCEKSVIYFDSSMNLVGFQTSSISINENQGVSSSFQVYFGAAEGTPATTVTLTVDTVGLGSAAAKEGIDFSLSSKSFAAEPGETSVSVTPIDNSVFTGTKKFYLVITSATGCLISAQNRFLVTITDDEHPLKKWLGSFTVYAHSYGDPGNWDEEWTVSTAAVDGNLNQISITGLGNGSSEPLLATIDKNALTITIESGQNLGTAYGPGNGTVKLYYGTSAIIDQVIAQDYITSQMLNDAGKVTITGTIDNDGNFYIEKMAMVLTDYDWCWDVFDTTWEKQ